MIIRISIFEVTKKISKHEGGTLRYYGKGKNWMEIGRKRGQWFVAENRDSESFESHSDREKLLIIRLDWLG